MYEKQIETFFSVSLSEKVSGMKLSGRDPANAFVALSEKLIIRGSSNVIRAWLKFRKSKFDANQDADSFRRLENLFLAIRQDFENDNEKLDNQKLIHLFVSDLDEVGMEKQLPSFL